VGSVCAVGVSPGAGMRLCVLTHSSVPLAPGKVDCCSWGCCYLVQLLALHAGPVSSRRQGTVQPGEAFCKGLPAPERRHVAVGTPWQPVPTGCAPVVPWHCCMAAALCWGVLCCEDQAASMNSNPCCTRPCGWCSVLLLGRALVAGAA
jgi:hypothetical protein